MTQSSKRINVKPYEAKIHLLAAENFYDIAKVKTIGREENLLKAIKGFLKALEYFNPSNNVLEYIQANIKLAQAYRSLSQVRDKEAYLKKAIETLEEVLRYATLDFSPVDYATANNNLGNTLSDLSDVKIQNLTLQRH
jgi:tetratricopeptide (TPR) repeat protein